MQPQDIHDYYGPSINKQSNYTLMRRIQALFEVRTLRNGGVSKSPIHHLDPKMAMARS